MGHHKIGLDLGVISLYFRVHVFCKCQWGIFLGCLNFKYFWGIDIPDIFWGTVDAGFVPTYEEKKKVPPPWGSHWLINIFSVYTDRQ